MGITEILRKIWLFPANKIKSSECFSKQPTQLIVEFNSSLWHIIVTIVCSVQFLDKQLTRTTLYYVPAIHKCRASAMQFCHKFVSGY